MSPQPITENTLFYGDNLKVLREYIATCPIFCPIPRPIFSVSCMFYASNTLIPI
jgi:hypothetical protein